MYSNKSEGFTLVEVLVASAVIMLGVTGYVSLQSEYVIADRNLNLRNLASQLATDKIQDLRFFECLMTTQGMYSFNDISSNTGGKIAPGRKNVVLSLSEGDTHEFDVYWQVIDLYYVDSDLDNIADTWVSSGNVLMPTDLPLYADMKTVTVNLSWKNAENQSQTLSVLGHIAPVQQSNTFQVLHRATSINSVP
ncbi:prepilin-type N-terminal cleavage/methylation domain-containing protein [Paraglaciecola aquimarina]|uniref:Prepilin-type N-terminal cleavage/methylation domain-containing protein n=1 Tax=Paraglaciecola aquimarina TaxID=1235557 RepID=A0ABU3T1J5_9ALTE|nr:prepilin-type N-terminal cleavage/methylation domain-containing protein [Paraglaciecola aquimarina]MDU0356078.1 prepilin-type N-terminal cleavage/methylation domain-containing protein [Paraglaciecola aquimarina]